MPVTNVLCKSVSVEKPIPSNLDLIRDLIPVVDEKTIGVLDQLMHSNAFWELPQSIQKMEVLEIEKNIPLTQIPHEVEKQGFTSVSLSSCLYFLSVLKGKENTALRRSFFEDGRIILSPTPFLVNGEFCLVAIGQDQCCKAYDQRPFSIRLLTPTKTFLHSLYKVLVAKV